MKWNENSFSEQQLVKIKSSIIWKHIQEVSNVDPFKILSMCSLEFFGEESTCVLGWKPSLRLLADKHRFELEAFLKLVWYNTTEVNRENAQIYGQVEKELFIESYRIGYLKTNSRASQNRKNAKLPRPPFYMVENWIKKKVRSNPQISGSSLWKLIPSSDELSEFYRDGDKLFCTENNSKSLTKRAFCLRVKKIKTHSNAMGKTI